MKDRVIILNGQVHDQMASAIIAQLMFLKLDGEDGKEISMYINSPGGSVTAGLAIYDVMQNIIETTERWKKETQVNNKTPLKKRRQKRP